jgi:hypothetical protein
MSVIRNLFIVLLFLGTSKLAAQSARSPFSAFGVGEYSGNALAHNQGMAGVGISNPQFWYLNNMNPALLVFNTYTTFEGGIMGETRRANNGALSEKNSGGNMNYLILAFPIKRTKWVNSIGLSPYTTTNYRFSYSDAIDGTTNTVKVTEEGSGGINKLSWSHGVSLHKYFSVGGRVNYLFSSITNQYTNILEQSDQTVGFAPAIYQRYHFADFSYTGAVSFHIDSLFHRNYRLNIAAVYDLQANVNTELYESLQRQSASGIVDSTTLSYNVPGQTTLPSVLTGGISFGKGDRWLLGIDGSISDFSQYKEGFGKQTPTLQKARKLSVGFEVTPDPTSLSNYLKRMTYRTGVSFEELPYLINGKPLKDFGINFGFSVPVSRVSSLDMAVKWGRRGILADNGIEENYFKIYFGVTFNDQWFIKRRFD